jgi:hypothetical protein
MDTLKQHLIGWRSITLTLSYFSQMPRARSYPYHYCRLALYIIWLSPNSFLDYSGPLHISVTATFP